LVDEVRIAACLIGSSFLRAPSLMPNGFCKLSYRTTSGTSARGIGGEFGWISSSAQERPREPAANVSEVGATFRIATGLWPNMSRFMRTSTSTADRGASIEALGSDLSAPFPGGAVSVLGEATSSLICSVPSLTRSRVCLRPAKPLVESNSRDRKLCRRLGSSRISNASSLATQPDCRSPRRALLRETRLLVSYSGSSGSSGLGWSKTSWGARSEV